MFRRTWWTRRRVVVGVLAVVLVVVAVVWECGTVELRCGQSLDEAKSALRQAGGADMAGRCGMFSTVGQKYQVCNSMWVLPDGRSVYLMCSRDSEDKPYRVDAFQMWQGWYKDVGTVELPEAETVCLRRSVFVVVPDWLR